MKADTSNEPTRDFGGREGRATSRESQNVRGTGLSATREVVNHERSSESRPRPQRTVNFSKLVRLGWMLEYLLEESRQVHLNDDGRRKLRDVADQALVEVGDAVSEDLRDELSRLAQPLDPERTPSKDELRVIQAELKGWMLGLTIALQAIPHPPTTRELEPQGAEGGD